MRCERFLVSARDSSHKYTPQSVKLQNILYECPLTPRPRAGIVTSHRPNSNSGSGGPGSKGPSRTRRRGWREQHPAGAVTVGGGVEGHVRRAAQRRRLPVVGHHVREGTAGAEASDGAALPAIVGPPVEHRHSPARRRSTQVAGRRRLDREARRLWHDG